jgi:oxygen-independent coproporphyrinogen-3 oxidase
MPRAAYIHVPFCRHHCGYCNFTVVAGRDDLIEDYLTAIDRELSALEQPREIDTLFLGGGTPTHLSPQQLSKLFDTIHRWFSFTPGPEFTIEANPADLTPETTELLAARGVTRVSLGGQSFDATKLRLLERDHGPADVARSVDFVRGAGMHVSLDLIFGAPSETLESWRRDLNAALRLTPDHVSTYGLTFERGTTFWGRLTRGDLTRLDEELERSMYITAIDALTAVGFEHYEVSNFAQTARRCRHNEVYWAGEEYYAVGPGAARYIDGRREMNHRSTTTWLRRVLGGESPVADSETLSAEDRARELLVLGLRRLDGVKRTEFLARTAYTLDALGGKSLTDFVTRGLLSDDGQTVRLTREGLMVSDAIWPYLL